MATEARAWVGVLRRSHDRLARIVGGLSPEQIGGPSYCRDWSVAQVLSHLGSGAEIGLTNLEAMVAGEPAPSRDVYQSIWDRWNAKSPSEMAADALVADEAHVARLEGLPDEQLGALSTEFLGRKLDATGIVGMRLVEHAVHTWDVEVTVDPGAAVQAGAVERVVDLLPGRIARLARGERPAAAPVELGVQTSEPPRSLFLRIGEEVSLGAEGGEPRGRLSLPAEAFLRLTYGRLDPGHTPAGVSIDGPVTLEELRALFPGF